MIETLPTPVKSANDSKDYKVIKLPNGLKVLLISDTSYDLEKLDQEEDDLEHDKENDEDSGGEEEEEEDMEDQESEDEEDEKSGSSGLKKSAAGLCIGMGCFSDPMELQGLAHFLEHMVFMGSKKYPSENEFDKFVSDHGGFDNAHTDCENTTFYFEVQRRYLAKSLDIFAQFFIEPLMLQSSMEREREAVDSEYQIALPSDENRMGQIFQSLAKPGHPMSKFMWGNKQSLTMGNLSDEEVHKKLHDFRKRHYTAQNMTLAVQSQATLESLENLVLESFAKVPNNGLDKESFGHLTDPFPLEDFHRLIKVAPMKNIFQLNLFWSLPPMLEKFRTKPLEYLSWIIGHEGEGSLILYLRQKVWALSLYAGCEGSGMELNSTYSQFSISITLTEKGFNEVNEVISAIFSYLQILKSEGPNQRIFDEIKEINELDFRYKVESQPVDNVEHLCENMQLYPPELIITGSEMSFEYDPDLIKDCTDRLRSDNVCLILLSKNFAEECDKIEPWFKTNYKLEHIPEDVQQSWSNPPIIPDLFLPQPNIFIAKDLALKIMDDKLCTKIPQKMVSQPYGELYYKFDTVFKQPRAFIKINLLVPCVRDSIENAVCMDLLVNCMVHQMTKDTYPADMAQLYYYVYATERGFQISLNGLNDKLLLLLSTILSHFTDFQANFKGDFFQAVKDQMKKEYYNRFIKPDKLERELRLFIMQDVFRTNKDKHQIIDNIGMQNVKDFHAQISQNPIFVQILVQGNMTPEDAQKAFEITSNTFSQVELVSKPEIAVKKVPSEGEKILRVDGFNAKDNNTFVIDYYQFGPGSLQDHIYLQVGSHIMEEPVFDTLRTKEQLGYTVYNTLRNTYGILGMSISVNSQATKFTADFVDERIESFLNWFCHEKLVNLSTEDFNSAITTLVTMKSQADVTLSEEVDRHWSEIVNAEYFFDRLTEEIKLLESCDKDKMVEFCTKLLSKSDSRRKLSVQVVGNSVINTDAPDEVPENINLKYLGDGEKFISNIVDYKNTLELYPLHKIVK